MTEEQRELAEALLGWSRSLDNQLLTFEDYQEQIAKESERLGAEAFAAESLLYLVAARLQ